jgi:hypothetical protein
MARKHGGDDRAIHIGIMRGCDWTAEDIARHFGVARTTINGHVQKHKKIVAEVEGWTRVAVSKHIEQRIASATRKALDDLETMKQRLRDDGYKLVHATVKHGLAQITDKETGEVKINAPVPDSVHLKAAETGIERMEGKALDRKAIMGLVEHHHTHELDSADLDSVLSELAQMNERRRALLPVQEREQDYWGGTQNTDIEEGELVNR